MLAMVMCKFTRVYEENGSISHRRKHHWSKITIVLQYMKILYTSHTVVIRLIADELDKYSPV